MTLNLQEFLHSNNTHSDISIQPTQACDKIYNCGGKFYLFISLKWIWKKKNSFSHKKGVLSCFMNAFLFLACFLVFCVLSCFTRAKNIINYKITNLRHRIMVMNLQVPSCKLKKMIKVIQNIQTGVDSVGETKRTSKINQMVLISPKHPMTHANFLQKPD